MKIARNCLRAIGAGVEGKKEKFDALRQDQKQAIKAVQVVILIKYYHYISYGQSIVYAV